MPPPANSERYKNHRFPGEIISHGVWLYYRFPLSYRDGIGNIIPFPTSPVANDREGPIQCQERLGGLLRYYEKKAA